MEKFNRLLSILVKIVVLAGASFFVYQCCCLGIQFHQSFFGSRVISGQMVNTGDEYITTIDHEGQNLLSLIVINMLVNSGKLDFKEASEFAYLLPKGSLVKISRFKLENKNKVVLRLLQEGREVFSPKMSFKDIENGGFFTFPVELLLEIAEKVDKTTDF